MMRSFFGYLVLVLAAVTTLEPTATVVAQAVDKEPRRLLEVQEPAACYFFSQSTYDFWGWFGGNFPDPYMSHKKCSNYCKDNQPFGRIYSYYGITNGDQCRCGMAKPEEGLKKDFGDCDKPCDSGTESYDDWCGNNRRIIVFDV